MGNGKGIATKPPRARTVRPTLAGPSKDLQPVRFPSQNIAHIVVILVDLEGVLHLPSRRNLFRVRWLGIHGECRRGRGLPTQLPVELHIGLSKQVTGQANAMQRLENVPAS